MRTSLVIATFFASSIPPVAHASPATRTDTAVDIRPSERLQPLGTARSLGSGAAEAAEAERSASFVVRLAIPGWVGSELTAKVESLRVLPDRTFLGKADLGPAVVPRPGPGWPETSVRVRLRRVGDDPLGSDYDRYESVEAVVLVADPRATAGYQRQDEAETEADEKGACRACAWPTYLDPASTNVRELLAGKHVRVFLDVDPSANPTVREATARAIAVYEGQAVYQAPVGALAVSRPFGDVASPLQATLAEPARSPAMLPFEAGATVSLTSGEAIVAVVDHQVAGRQIPFALERVHRSGYLSAGPLGPSWTSPLFAHLVENLDTGEVEYVDGRGHAWRFLPATVRDDELPATHERDPLGSYAVPKGLYLRLERLRDGTGWRLLDRHHNSWAFDTLGRLTEMSDRHRQGRPVEVQGSTMRFSYDLWGQLKRVEDDLGRLYRFTYDEDPTSPNYGLLQSVTDFVDRKVEYEYDGERRLVRVLLPEVENDSEAYAAFSHTGEERPELRYEYATAIDDTSAPLHGALGRYRLAASYLPGGEVPRLRIAYQANTGRVERVSAPRSDDTHGLGAGVGWRLVYSQPLSSAAPTEAIVVRSPWNHAVSYTLEDGRTTRRSETLEVTQATGDVVAETATTVVTYTDDGRVESVTSPGRGTVTNEYPDSDPQAEEVSDRLQLANVVQVTRAAATQLEQGTAAYPETVTSASYMGDNLPAAVVDGVGRAVELAVSLPSEEARVDYTADSVGGAIEYDRFGRAERLTGGQGGETTEDGENPFPVVRAEYGTDARDAEGAGLLRRVVHGSEGHERRWSELEYDDQWNVDETKTSQGTITRTTWDEWDRAVRVVSGITVDGRFQPVGASICAAGEGAQAERAFDVAGHLVRERRLQDFVSTDGTIGCRWVETRYRHNAREQLVAIEQTHVADPGQSGQVLSEPTELAAREYDEHGRLLRSVARNLRNPDLATVYRYDAAGRVAGVTIGEEGERRTGYDLAGRIVYRTDGDVGVWRGRWDAWDRLYREDLPTGAVALRVFDAADNPVRELVYSGDPDVPGNEILADVRMHVTSFGAVDRTIQVLDEGGEALVTETVFDAAGRPESVWSGPPIPGDERVDRDRARRELAIRYEPEGGRKLEEAYGGTGGSEPLHGVRYEYFAASDAPWPDRTTLFEAVPGRADLVDTFTTTYTRDAFGRPVLVRRNDGSSLWQTYDRTSAGVISTRTGAGTETFTSFDGRGLALRVQRPAGRGSTTYTYDLDGRLLSKAAATAGANTWLRLYAYDPTGRVASVSHDDGTVESFTYDPDSAVATRTARDGVVVTYDYDAANNVVSAVPSLAGSRPASLATLDAGDFTDYDVLSRPTAHRRGRSGPAGADPRLGVSYTGYDLAGRLEAEVLGGREPLSWGYDVWSRPTGVGLPGQLAAVSGLERAYDTLDRLTAIGAVGHATAGADLAWGGGRLYGITTRGPLGTAARYGYIGGPGLERSGQGDASLWKLGTLSWGAGGVDVTQPPAVLWDTFSYGYRGSEGDPRDGLKIGRTVEHPQGLGLFAGMGWSWGYDAATRLTMAELGPGSLEGFFSPDAAERWSYGFGEGDELERVIREEAGELVTYESGPDGRVTSRAGEPLRYDAVGRRIEDDRATYRWSWRGELVEATLKPTVDSPYAGHQVRWLYDATGRLTARDHYGPLPEGEVGDSQRSFIERRAFLWDGWTRLGEAGYADPDETHLRWRVTYLPGPSGLDDALQAVVEVVDVPGSPYVGKRLYTYLRDEMGSVVGIVAEEEGGAGSSPPVPVRYRHSPYGETEVGPDDGFLDGVGVPDFDTAAASADAVAGRFPGGRNLLFQGLWVDPVVGLAYARHRWLDVRDGLWLSEDPMEDVDSPNLYAFAEWQPSMYGDPMGLQLGLGPCGVKVGEELERCETEVAARSKEVDEAVGQALADPRVQGGLLFAAGIAECGGAMASAKVPPVAVGLGMLCADHVATGSHMLVTGQDVETVKHQALRGGAEALGFEPVVAHQIADVGEGIIDAVAGARAAVAVTAPGWSPVELASSHSTIVPKGARYGPLNPGPLADDIAATFRSGSYTARTLEEPMTLYRVIGEGGRVEGSFWTATRPQGPLQSVVDLALDQNWGNTATTVIEARIPTGTTFYEGAAATQGGLVGGGSQVYIPRVDPSWIVQP